MKLSVQNFRSIKDETFDLAPITVFYGPNGSGKSTVLYSLLTFKNIVMNPNQRVDGFFDYGSIDLGGFENVIHNGVKNSRIGIEVTASRDTFQTTNSIQFGNNHGELSLRYQHPLFDTQIALSQEVHFPFSLSRIYNEKFEAKDGSIIQLSWNGFFLNGAGGSGHLFNPENNLLGNSTIAYNEIHNTGFVPLKRGFSKPTYSPLPVSGFQTTEDDIATLIAVERHFDSKISEYLEGIANREFRLSTIPGTAVYLLNTIDRTTRIPVGLVNDGFGINQLVHLLAICLSPNYTTVCIEEPEIHLHPSAVRALVQALIRITQREGKRFVIATHSEVFISTLLAEVASGNLKTDDLSCYLTTKEGKESKFEKQEVNEKGQISGGLQAFAQAELENTKILLGISDE